MTPFPTAEETAAELGVNEKRLAQLRALLRTIGEPHGKVSLRKLAYKRVKKK